MYVLSQGENNVGSFAIDLGSGKLSLLNKTSPADMTPTSILLDPSGTVAYVLNTGSNSITEGGWGCRPVSGAIVANGAICPNQSELASVSEP